MGKGLTVRSEGAKAVIFVNFQYWPKDSSSGGKTAESRVKNEQNGVIETKKRINLGQSTRGEQGEKVSESRLLYF